ncbi:hypothetical protein N9X61_01195 [Sulfurimonas sp.]|nr:hypothetical protein [Sulfurimonas sp.]
MDFNELNTELHQLAAPHRFARKPNELDRGYMKISNWLNDLCYHYEKKRQSQEKFDEDEFKALVESYRVKINELSDSEYKIGLLKALNEV